MRSTHIHKTLLFGDATLEAQFFAVIKSEEFKK